MPLKLKYDDMNQDELKNKYVDAVNQCRDLKREINDLKKKENEHSKALDRMVFEHESPN